MKRAMARDERAMPRDERAIRRNRPSRATSRSAPTLSGGWPTTSPCGFESCWLARPHERAHDLAVHLLDAGRVDSPGGEEFAGVLGAVDPRRLDLDLLEADLREEPPVFRILQRAGD